MKRRQSGSLLIEVTFVMMAAGALALVSFAMLSGTKKKQDHMEDGNSLMIAEQAVRTFMLRQKRLPCPDQNGSGYESVDAAGQCPAGLVTGYLPFVTLQLEKPVNHGAIRYGVWRSTGADLASAAAPLSAAASLDSSSQLLDAIAMAASKTSSLTALPFVAQLNGKNENVDCSASFDNPAFVVAVQAGDASTSGGNCFADDPASGSRVLAVGRQELLGWAKSRFSG